VSKPPPPPEPITVTNLPPLEAESLPTEQDPAQYNVQNNLTNEKFNTNSKNILYSNLDIITVDGTDCTAYLGK